MSEPTPVLDDQQFMDALFDVIIPGSASGDIPGAGSLGLSAAVAAGLREDPMLGPLVEGGLRTLREAALAEPGEGLRAMTPSDAAAFVKPRLSAQPFVVMGLLRYLYPAYYQHPRVLAGIGEVTRPPFPEGFDVEPTDPELMAVLLSRRKKSPA